MFPAVVMQGQALPFADIPDSTHCLDPAYAKPEPDPAPAAPALPELLDGEGDGSDIRRRLVDALGKVGSGDKQVKVIWRGEEHVLKDRCTDVVPPELLKNAVLAQ